MSVATETLALYGGPRTILHELAPFSTYDDAEMSAARRVVESGLLSGYVADGSEEFWGGPEVCEFENAWLKAFGTKYAIAVNSATSGLIAALGAIDIRPGDEVIVSPWTMSATATAILVWGAKPVFVDIEDTTYGLDPKAVKAAITDRTAAILVTHAFGAPARIAEIIEIADVIPVVEDLAQSPGRSPGTRRSHRSRSVGDIGVYSLNQHKHMRTGEGGVCVTNNDVLLERMALIRNHGETVSRNPNLFGFNFRMGEIEAAIGIEQLKKLDEIVVGRLAVAQQLQWELGGCVLAHDGSGRTLLRLPSSMSGRHSFYVFAMQLASGMPRQAIARALRAEGVPIVEGYQNLHRLPIHRHLGAQCPVAERLHDETMLGIEMCVYQLDQNDTALIGKAFRKVWANLDRLT